MSVLSTEVVAPTLALSRRSIFAMLRQPQLVVPSMIFPLMITAVNTASLGRSTSLPGFPAVDSFLDFAMATTILQGVLFGAIGAGTDMAVDIEGGFFDRLVTSPVSRPAILLGRLAGSAVLALMQTVIFTALLMAFGASIKSGAVGYVVILATAALLGIGIGGLAIALALRTGSAEAVQATFPAFFISLFLSSAFFPAALMSGWFKTVALVNPMSTMIDAVRRLMISGLTFADVAKALLVPSLLAVASVSLAALALRRRLAAG